MIRTYSSKIKQPHHNTPPGLLLLTIEQEERREIYNILETNFDAELRLIQCSSKQPKTNTIGELLKTQSDDLGRKSK